MWKYLLKLSNYYQNAIKVKGEINGLVVNEEKQEGMHWEK